MRGLPVVTKQEPGQPTERYIYGFQQYPSSDRVRVAAQCGVAACVSLSRVCVCVTLMCAKIILKRRNEPRAAGLEARGCSKL